MKIRAFLPMAAAGLIGLGALGLVGVRAYAQSAPAPVPSQTAPSLSQADVEDQKGSLAPDTDNIQEQVGDQNGPDTGGGAEVD